MNSVHIGSKELAVVGRGGTKPPYRFRSIVALASLTGLLVDRESHAVSSGINREVTGIS